MSTNTQDKSSEYVFMFCRSKESDSDWYGDFSYYDNGLEKYLIDCKLWEYKVNYGSSHGSGVESIAVKTTLENLKLLGWECDYENFECSEDFYNRFK